MSGVTNSHIHIVYLNTYWRSMFLLLSPLANELLTAIRVHHINSTTLLTHERPTLLSS